MYPPRWIASIGFILVCSVTSPTAATDSITTFPVAQVEPSKTVHREVRSLSSEDLKRWARDNEILTLENFQLAQPLAGGMDHRVANAFVGTVFKAYSDHYPLELSVEDIWVAIAQGVSMHLNENSEKFRHFFVSHDGKKKLELIVDKLRISDNERTSNVNTSVPAINWPAAVRLMGDLIKADMKADLATLISQPFSQTTTVQQAVFDACLMDTVKTYYDYSFVLTCGIPQVTLRGSPADFQSVIDRLNQLKLMFTDLHWWLNPLLLHVQKFKASAQGKPDIDWWQKVCHQVGGGSDISMLAGWLADFVPYVADGKGHYRKARQDHQFFSGEIINGIDFSNFNEAVTQTDFILDDNGHEIKMKLIAGFMGIGQNPTTGALRPILGWITTLPSAKTPTMRIWDEM